MGPSREELFRTNVGWAKVMLAKERETLEDWRAVFEEYGPPDGLDPIEMAAWELLGLHQDRTPLMNAAFRRWQNGEHNEFFDRITLPIDFNECIDLTGLSDDEFITFLFGRGVE